jgi:hypothetical protein
MRETTDFEAQQQKEMEESHAKQEVFNAEVAGSKREGYPDAPFYGTGTDDVKAHRQANGWYTESDFEPTPPDPISDYRGPRTHSDIRYLDEVRPYVEFKENLAREKYGKKYDEIFDEIILPRLEREGVTREEIQRAALENENVIEKLYQWGLEQKRLKGKLPSMAQVDNMSVEQFTAALDALHNEPEDETEESGEAADRREMKRMNKLATPVDFERELDRLKAKGW